MRLIYYHHHHHHIIISFMQGIYTYIPETNYVPREYSVAAILLLLFMVLISLVSVVNLLYFYISTSRSVCAVPNMAVFCSSLVSWFPGMLLTYFIIIITIIIIIIEFLTSHLWLGNIHISWVAVINRISLGGLTWSLKISYNWTCAKNYRFLQLCICIGVQIKCC